MAQNKKTKTPDPQVTQLQDQIEELTQKYQRALADYQNLEKRTQVQQTQFLRITTATLIGKFLNILDNLERATTHIKDPGLDMVITSFKQLLKDEDVNTIEVLGKNYDATTMECVELVTGPKDQVIKEILPGYTFNNQLIRPAKVLVGNGQKSPKS